MIAYLLVLLANPPSAVGLFTASDLLARCTSGFSQDVGQCHGYIAAVHDTVRAYEQWNNFSEFCHPGTPEVKKLRDVFVDYVRAKPDYLSAQASSVVVLALRDRYQCVAR